MGRPEVSDQILLAALDAMTVRVGQKIEKHGRGAYISNHETLGIVAEEYHELIDAVHQNDPVDVANELMDIAVAALFGVASMMEKEERLKAASEALQDKISKVQDSLE
jgi:NTP pyrophosphatase (non-canonical NTP hydrolase)